MRYLYRGVSVESSGRRGEFNYQACKAKYPQIKGVIILLQKVPPNSLQNPSHYSIQNPNHYIPHRYILPFVYESELFPLICIIARRTIAPDSNRTTVKLDASMTLSPNANRHSTEFAANAINASPVKIIIFTKSLLSLVIKDFSIRNIAIVLGGPMDPHLILCHFGNNSGGKS